LQGFSLLTGYDNSNKIILIIWHDGHFIASIDKKELHSLYMPWPFSLAM